MRFWSLAWEIRLFVFVVLVYRKDEREREREREHKRMTKEQLTSRC